MPKYVYIIGTFVKMNVFIIFKAHLNVFIIFKAHHSRSLKEFVDAQTEYFSKCYQYMKDLQDHLKFVVILVHFRKVKIPYDFGRRLAYHKFVMFHL